MKINITFEDVTGEELARLTNAASGVTVTTQSAVPLVAEVVDDEAPSPVDVSGQLDSAGQPWNSALHSSNKTKNKDGTWKKRKGAAEAPAPVAAPPTLPVFTPPTLPQTAPVTQQQPPVFPTVPPATTTVQFDLNALFAKIQAGLVSGKVTNDVLVKMVATVNQQFGLQAAIVPEFANRPDALIACANYLTMIGA